MAMKRSIILYCIGLLLVLRKCMCDNHDPVSDREHLPSNSNVSSLVSSALKLTYEGNVSESSPAVLASLADNSSFLSKPLKNTSSSESSVEVTTINREQGTMVKTLSTSKPDTSRTDSISEATADKNSNENSSKSILNTSSHENPEIADNSSSTTSAGASTTNVPATLISQTNDPFVDSIRSTDLTTNKGADLHNKGRLLVAVVKTLVTTSISSSTTVVFSTCRTPADAPTDTCTRRRRRRRNVLLKDFQFDERSLDSSALEPSLSGATVWAPHKKSGRLIMWSSSVQTVTFFTTSTNTATVVTASFACSFSGLPAACPDPAR